MTEFEAIKELLPGYVLGTLDPAERMRVREFLDACRGCREEIAHLTAVTERILETAVELDPAPALRGRLQERIGQPAPAAAPARPKAAAPEPAGGFWAPLWSFFGRPAVQLGMAVLLIALIAANFLLWRAQERPGNHAINERGMQALAVQGTADTPEASGFILISADGQSGALVADNLPGLAPGTAYQVWLAIDEAGVLESGGLFQVDENGYGGLGLQATRPLSEFTRIGVTVEPESGSSGPTGLKVLGRDLP